MLVIFYGIPRKETNQDKKKYINSNTSLSSEKKK